MDTQDANIHIHKVNPKEVRVVTGSISNVMFHASLTFVDLRILPVITKFSPGFHDLVH